MKLYSWLFDLFIQTKGNFLTTTVFIWGKWWIYIYVRSSLYVCPCPVGLFPSARLDVCWCHRPHEGELAAICELGTLKWGAESFSIGDQQSHLLQGFKGKLHTWTRFKNAQKYECMTWWTQSSGLVVLKGGYNMTTKNTWDYIQCMLCYVCYVYSITVGHYPLQG